MTKRILAVIACWCVVLAPVWAMQQQNGRAYSATATNGRTYSATSINGRSYQAVTGPTFARNGAAMGITARPSQASDAVTQYHIFLPNPTLSGNTVIIWIRYNAAAQTVTWTDNVGTNTYTRATSCLNGASTHEGEIWYISGVAPGTQDIKFTLPAARTYVQGQAFEFYNVGALDQATCGNGSGTSFSAPSLNALTASGDLVFQFATITGLTTQSSWTAGSQSNITWKLRTAMITDPSPCAVQYGVYNSTASFSPTLTGGTTGAYISAAVAFKANTSGSAPASGIHVDYVQHDNSDNETDTSTALELGTTGNAIYLAFNSGCDTGSICALATGVSDGTNTWEQVGSAVVGQEDDQNNAPLVNWLAVNVTPGTYNITTTNRPRSTSNGHGNSWMWADISGAGTVQPVDLSYGISGAASTWGQNNASASPLTYITGATPAAQNELQLMQQSVGFDSTNGVTSPSTAKLLNCYYVTESNSSHCDLNLGWATNYNGSSTSAQTWSLSNDNSNGVGPGDWSASAVSLSSSAGSISTGSWSVIQHKAYDNPCAGAGSCTFSGLTATGSGHILVVQLWVNDPTVGNGFIGSVTGAGGAWTVDGGFFASESPFVQGRTNLIAYNLSPNSGVTSITANINTTDAAAVHWGADVWEVAWSGSAVMVDNANSGEVTCSGTSCPGQALVLSGSKDIIFQMGTPVTNGNGMTAISGGAGYTTYEDFLSTSDAGFAVAINTTAATAPTWTNSGSGDKALVSAFALKGI